MSQYSGKKKIVINGAQWFPALYLNESFMGAIPLPLLLPCRCSSWDPGLLRCGQGHQPLTSAYSGYRSKGWRGALWVGLRGGRTGREIVLGQSEGLLWLCFSFER